MNQITKAIRELEAKRGQIETAIRTLHTLNGTGATLGVSKRKHRMSAEGRARIAAAARKRWAKLRAKNKNERNN